MIFVCDAIMGAGKSESVITYIREHPWKKFIYATPYLDEARRISDACPGVGLVEPNNKLSKYGYRKSEHTAALIREGKNIATTHQALKCYTEEMLNDIREKGYMLIIDENVETLDKFQICPDDLKMAVDAGYVSVNDGVYTISGDLYHGEALRELFFSLRSRNLTEVVDSTNASLYYWYFPPELIASFDTVYIMTYLFRGQSLYYMLKMHDMPFRYIGVEKGDSGIYRFTKGPAPPPDYVRELASKIHIVDNARMNAVGNGNGSLSVSWFKAHPDGVEQLRRNIGNYFNNIHRGVPSRQNLWSTYKEAKTKLTGKGYSRGFVPFNTRASNAYRERDHLTYAVNLYMNVGNKLFYKKHGIYADDDMYALSTMVQWIWRSAIRDGSEIDLYLPSGRMRKLLTDWMDVVSKGGDYIEE